MSKAISADHSCRRRHPLDAKRSRRAFSWAVWRYPRIVECGGDRFRERRRACGGRPELRGGCGSRHRRGRCQSGRSSHQAGPRGRCASRISRERSRPAGSQEAGNAQHSGETDGLRHAGQSGTSRCAGKASSETSSSRANRQAYGRTQGQADGPEERKTGRPRRATLAHLRLRLGRRQVVGLAL